MVWRQFNLRVTPLHRLMRFCQFCGIVRDPDRQVHGFAPIQIADQASYGDLKPLQRRIEKLTSAQGELGAR
jgi:hypothetical protein